MASAQDGPTTASPSFPSPQRLTLALAAGSARNVRNKGSVSWGTETDFRMPTPRTCTAPVSPASGGASLSHPDGKEAQRRDKATASSKSLARAPVTENQAEKRSVPAKAGDVASPARQEEKAGSSAPLPPTKAPRSPPPAPAAPRGPQRGAPVPERPRLPVRPGEDASPLAQPKADRLPPLTCPE